MAYLRVTEFEGQVPERDSAADWYRLEGGANTVRVERTDSAARLDATASLANSARTDWMGVRLLREGDERQGSMLFHLRFPVPESFFYEFEAWYRDDHVPILLEEPTWFSCELYRCMNPGYYTFAAVHQLEPQALTSAARDRSLATPWWARLNEQPWFHDRFLRMRLIPMERA